MCDRIAGLGQQRLLSEPLDVAEIQVTDVCYIQQVQGHLLAHQYEGLIEKSQLSGKGRRRKRRGPARK